MPEKQIKKELVLLEKSLRLAGLGHDANIISGIIKKSEVVVPSRLSEEDIVKIINAEADSSNADEKGSKFYIPISEVLLGYLISEISKFLLEETINKIKSEIYELGLGFGLKVIAFEIFKYFFLDQKRLLSAEVNIPTLIGVLKNNSGIIPSIFEKDVNEPFGTLDAVKSEIMSSNKPFTVDVNSIITSYNKK